MEGSQQPPAGVDTRNTTPGLIGVSILFALCLLAYGVRIYTRIRPTVRLTVGDYVVTAALLCELIVLACLLQALHLGLGRYDYYISAAELEQIMKCFFPLGILSFWASSLARISIGSMLLRFQISKLWKIVLWTLIATQVAMAVGADIFQLAQCRPIRAMWEPVAGAVCMSATQSRIYSYIYAAMGIASDLVFATMPTYFIWSLHRPVTERMLVNVLMALGTIAAVAGVMKLVFVSAWDPRKVTLRDWVPLLWWYRVEEIGLIFAACAPFLKPMIERMLIQLGASKFRFVTLDLNTIPSGPWDGPNDVENPPSSTLPTTGHEGGKQVTTGKSASFSSSDGSEHFEDGKKPHVEQGDDGKNAAQVTRHKPEDRAV